MKTVQTLSIILGIKQRYKITYKHRTKNETGEIKDMIETRVEF